MAYPVSYIVGHEQADSEAAAVTHVLSPHLPRWGLDWIWPDLLGYPSDKIAVIDEVCLFHPESARFKRNSLYKVGKRKVMVGMPSCYNRL